MSDQALDKLLTEAGELGTGVIITAGGEPFMRPGLTELMEKHPKLFFVIFTNGLLLNSPEYIKTIMAPNIYPVISIEGNVHNTDSRRGKGIYAKTGESMDIMREVNKQFGLSVTVTRNNFSEVLSEDFQTECRKKGSSSLFYIDYVPFQEGTEDIELDEQQRVKMLNWLNDHKRKDMLSVAFPGDEKPFGGCLAAGRGFVHIAADGSVEPCPFAPVSIENVAKVGYEQALRSPFLQAVRDKADILEDESHGCALFQKKDELNNIRKSCIK
jgi:MoaA/NifB/PqqE/SkfB family radical SAM enzyme